MIVRLTFKTPDAVDEALNDVPEEQRDEARAAAEKWVEYGEYLYVDIDTEKGTCTPVPVKET